MPLWTHGGSVRYDGRRETKVTRSEWHKLAEVSERRDYEIVRRASASRVVLSIVIPNYNTEFYVGDAIKSALGQTFPDLELIVIDDGSTDGSVARILRFDDPRLTVIRQQNRGLAGTRNLGIAMSRGRYIGFLDSDDIWFTDKAEKHIRLMDRAPDVGLTFSWSEYLTEAGDRTGQLLISRCAEPTARQLALRNHIGNGSTPVVRADCFGLAGVFNESLYSCEDWEMWVRIALLRKTRIQSIQEVLTGYRVRKSSLSFQFEGTPSFISSGMEVVTKFGSYGIPNYSKADQCRSVAELYRISSRKALTAGQRAASRKCLWKALKHSPTLFLRDFRAIGLLCLQLLPKSVTHVVTDFGYRSLRKWTAGVGTK